MELPAPYRQPFKAEWRTEAHLAHDRTVLREVLSGDCYGLRKLKRSYDVLLDVGSNIGTVSFLALSLGLAREAVCFESDPGFSRVHFEVLGEEPFTKQCRLVSGRASAEALGTELARAKEQGKAVLLKMDIEGWEYPILDQLIATGAIACVDDLVIELHEQRPELVPDQSSDVEVRKAWTYAYIDRLEQALGRPLRRSFIPEDPYVLGTVSTYV